MCIQPSSDSILKYHAFEQFQNDLYDYFYENETCEIETIEKLLLKKLSKKAYSTASRTNNRDQWPYNQEKGSEWI